ncbi:ABC transporter substrate-binding protein [Actinocorallia sp. A-T 12471]|uniref:ABC transporter substrate-binding protein n=1 Tax=Actinocorallia sp. A-T 12471 TaxID=3089813 RepID=UPI0029D1AC0E|nr:ABC transporter substrate-binding protein [Actinocorallia sp. A-T 12471]MDX6740799.1 ABC transporter substrate-binding protein [Actinocorallia sp. A-T 12471]
MNTPRVKDVRRLGPLALLAAAALTACTAGGGGATDSPAVRDTLVFGVDGTLPNLDPALAVNSTVDQAVVPMYEALVDYSPAGEIVGVLAAEWTVADDARSIAFKLRPGAKFHDGSPVTSADVAYTLDRVRKLGVGVADSVAAYDTVEITDDTAFTIRLKTPSSLFLGALSKIYVLNADAVQEGDDLGQSWLATHAAGSGPYELASYAPNQQIEYRRVEGADPKIAKKVIYRLIPESATQRDELASGNIDVSDAIDPIDVPKFEADANRQVVRLKKPQGLYVFFNTRQGPTADKDLREAIRLSYDYQGHADTILRGFGGVASGPLPDTMGCRADIAPARQDLAAAKALVDKSGHKGVKLTMAYQSMFTEHAEAATALQSSLKEIGVTLELKPVTYPNFIASLKKVETTPQLSLLWDNPPTPDPGSLLYRTYSSKFVGSGTNYGQYRNPKVDALLDKAVESGDADVQCAAYKEAQTLIDADAATMNIADHETVVVAPKGVTGIEFHPAHVGYVPQTYKVG